MSLISNTNVPALKTAAQLKTELLLATPRLIFNSVFSTWKAGVELIWKDPNPQAVLDAVQAASPGAPAELFQRSAAAAALLEAQLPGCTTATIALVKAFTVNQDGSITITLPPSA